MTNGDSLSFALPEELHAAAPPERRGLRRDHVRLMVTDRATGETRHMRFHRLADVLRPGDVLVLNVSRTLPSSLPGVKDGRPVEVRLARRLGERSWEAYASAALVPGDVVQFGEALSGRVAETGRTGRMARLEFSLSGTELWEQIYRMGEPIRYEYITEPWQLHYYQTVYGNEPGSVEMPSAGRAFSWELLFRLRNKGVRLAFVQLHTGLSYVEDGEEFQVLPDQQPEPYAIPEETVDAVRKARAEGGRVVAVGTTVVRALESAALATGELHPTEGWSRLYIRPGYRLRVCDGILTGFHEPEATHLSMLSAFISPERLFAAYRKAIAEKYLWHEFGDMNLII